MTTTVRNEYDATLGYHPSIPPLDIRLGLTSSITSSLSSMDDAPLRWGILASGKVARDFTLALQFLASRRGGHEVIAVGSRTMERAQEFATCYSIPTAHGSYAALCSDPQVEIIYVASLHPHHKEHAQLALHNGKHVLVEKPMTMNADDAHALYELGEKLGLFVGEGMWTRFFPAVEWANREMMMHPNKNTILGGSCRVVQADFSIDGDDVGPYPDDSIYKLELGGGTAWTMGPYVVGAAMLPFHKPPNHIAAAGIVPPQEDGAGALAAGMTLTFESTSSLDGTSTIRSMASCLVSLLAASEERTVYAGKGGRITLHGPAHCPTSVTLTCKEGGREGGALKNTILEFPLPIVTQELQDLGGYKLPNSMGFIYEIEAVRRLIAAGERTFPQWTPVESVGCIRTIESVLAEINKHG